eukprot:TRINITY_DN2083_c0_g1_i2.p1 TRINITY_DN2083_c0_g1~~TRINITY_DN2083_c0_g1_i2.p1  ORF type:complete len:113 (+),score=12.77 TRINITY_DN2083_c0_g1_i2:126-464(+)
METPSKTLFIADLPNDTQESDFDDLFRNASGFQSTRLRRDKRDNVVGFAEFESITDATKMKESLENQFRKRVPKPFTVYFSNPKTKTNPRRNDTSSLNGRICLTTLSQGTQE